MVQDSFARNASTVKSISDLNKNVFKKQQERGNINNKTVVVQEYMDWLNAPRQRGTELLGEQSSHAGGTPTAAASAAAQ